LRGSREKKNIFPNENTQTLNFTELFYVSMLSPESVLFVIGF